MPRRDLFVDPSSASSQLTRPPRTFDSPPLTGVLVSFSLPSYSAMLSCLRRCGGLSRLSSARLGRIVDANTTTPTRHPHKHAHTTRAKHTTTQVANTKHTTFATSVASVASAHGSSSSRSTPVWALRLLAGGSILALLAQLADEDTPILESLALKKIMHACGIVAFVGDEPATPYLLEVR